MIIASGDDVKLQADNDLVVLIINGKPIVLTRGEFSFLISKPDVVNPVYYKFGK